MRHTLRLLHTSDIHLGDGAADGHAALAAVMAMGRVLAADGLLIAGDLFDHSRVRDEEIVRFLEEVAYFNHPVVVLPGNHDCYDGTSVYRRPGFAAAPPNLCLLTEPDAGPVTVPGLSLEVWGRPTVDHHPAFRPLHQVPARRGDNWYVVLAHGHLIDRPGSTAASPILPSDIAAAPCDYIALGHWDHFHDASQGAVRAYYSGAPRSDHIRTPAVSLVEFGLNGISMERHPIG